MATKSGQISHYQYWYKSVASNTFWVNEVEIRGGACNVGEGGGEKV